MFRDILFICLINNLIIIGGASNNIARWTITEEQNEISQLELDKPAMIVRSNKPLIIILENYKAFSAVCRNKHSDYKISIILEYVVGKPIVTMTVTTMSNDMSTVWECLMKKTNGFDQYILFKIHIIGIENMTIRIGRSLLKPVISASSELSYDGIINYWYTDGEAVDVVCKSQNTQGLTRLTYYNGNGTKLIETDEIPSQHQVEFRKIMTFENNNDVIDCSYISPSKIEYIYRINFISTYGSNVKDPFKITINNIERIPSKRDSKNIEYLYKYYDGEIITVSCELTVGNHSKVSFKFEKPGSIIKHPGSEEPWKQTIRLRTDGINKKHLVCSSEEYSVSANILFIFEKIEPIIVGLQPQDIIQEYSKNSKTWLIDYFYTVEQVLNLTCIVENNLNYRWIFRGSTVNFNSFRLKADDNGTSIVCETSKMRRATINLYSKPSLPSNDTDSNKTPLFIIIGGAVLVATAVITAVFLIIWCRVTRNTVAQQSSTTNLTRRFKPSIPNPGQYETPVTHYIPSQDTVMLNNYLYNGSTYLSPSDRSIEDHEYHYPAVLFNVPSSSDNVSKSNNDVNRRRNRVDYVEPAYCEFN